MPCAFRIGADFVGWPSAPDDTTLAHAQRWADGIGVPATGASIEVRAAGSAVSGISPFVPAGRAGRLGEVGHEFGPG